MVWERSGAGGKAAGDAGSGVDEEADVGGSGGGGDSEWVGLLVAWSAVDGARPWLDSRMG
jgi:hypothetical protein